MLLFDSQIVDVDELLLEVFIFALLRQFGALLHDADYLFLGPLEALE